MGPAEHLVVALGGQPRWLKLAPLARSAPARLVVDLPPQAAMFGKLAPSTRRENVAESTKIMSKFG